MITVAMPTAIVPVPELAHATLTSTEGPEAGSADDHLVITHVQYRTYSDVEGPANIIVNARRDIEALLDIFEDLSVPPVIHIPLCNAAGTIEASALIDGTDWPLVCNDRWSVSPDGYAVNDKGAYLHLLIMCPDLNREETIFLNGSEIDCRRSNMRNVECMPVSLTLPSKVRAKLEALVATHGISVEMVIARLVAGVPSRAR